VGVVADANAVRPETIRELYTRLNAQDKQAFSGIVQTHLENRLNAALDKKSVIAGSKFRDAIVGTPKEQANFDEMMRGVAVAQGVDPKAVVSGANRLLEILDRTGRTPGVGSQTQPRSEMARELGKTRVGDIASVVSASPTRPAVERWDNFIIRRRYEGLAKALTDPNSVDTLVKLAKLQPNGLTARYYAAALLGLDEVTAAQ
jgi:hypothetical protein